MFQSCVWNSGIACKEFECHEFLVEWLRHLNIQRAASDCWDCFLLLCNLIDTYFILFTSLLTMFKSGTTQYPVQTAKIFTEFFGN